MSYRIASRPVEAHEELGWMAAASSSCLSLSSLCQHHHPSVSTVPPQVPRTLTVSEAPPPICPLESSAQGFSSLITHQDIPTQPHFLCSHSCIKMWLTNPVNVLLLFNTITNPVHCGSLETIFIFKCWEFLTGILSIT